MMRPANLFKCITFLLLTLTVTGCATTINKIHPALTQATDSNVVKLYIIRSKEAFNGITGLPFSVSLNDEKLMTIAKGEYTLVYLKPFSGNVTVQSWTVKGMNNSMSKATASKLFTFGSRETYYLTFVEIRGGLMQGSIYTPISIPRDKAVSLTQKLKPVGMAIGNPISHTP